MSYTFFPVEDGATVAATEGKADRRGRNVILDELIVTITPRGGAMNRNALGGTNGARPWRNLMPTSMTIIL